MESLGFARLWSFLTGTDLVMGLLWLGLAGFTVALVVLIWTRWGQIRPLRKCLLLSLLAHVLLAGYAATVEIVTTPPPEEPILRVAYLDAPVGPGMGPGDPESGEAGAGTKLPALDVLSNETVTQEANAVEPEPPREKEPQQPVGPAAMPDAPPPATVSELTAPETAPEQKRPEPQPATTPPPTDDVADHATRPPAVPVSADDAELATSPEIERVAPPKAVDDSGQPDKWAAALVREAYEGVAMDEKSPANQDDPSTSSTLTHAADMRRSPWHPERPAAPRRSAAGDAPSTSSVPEVYKLRMAGDHEGIAQGGGGSPETEAAVKAALTWLAANQAATGRWEAGRHGAGRATTTEGQNRRNAGLRADTGMTGLALLSFLASGQTHLSGEHRETVRRGLEYLLGEQDSAGCLAGQADSFAAMYCHAMATFALSEAYGMSRDQRLREAVRRAIAYTVAAQDRTGGGWRYRPGDPGDTSQLGWQFMALKSAEIAGMPIPPATREGVIRYLRSVSSGRAGGLASYRPGEQVSRSMTAEALFCWQLLGLDPSHPACGEAGDSLMGDLPGEGQANIYYWYYATLALHEVGGEHWRRWNEALRTHLLRTQRIDGALAGTWDPDALWGGHGGRVYSTALSTLCLEVYYRYLPLTVQRASNPQAGSR